jgi:hypothetical protein
MSAPTVVDTNKDIGDKNHLKVFATADAAKCQSMFEARQAENGGTD